MLTNLPTVEYFGLLIRESPAQFENRIKPRVYVRRIKHSLLLHFGADASIHPDASIRPQKVVTLTQFSKLMCT